MSLFYLNLSNNLRYLYCLILLILIFPSFGDAFSKEGFPDTKPQLFLDCDDCDFSYFRRNVPFVNFVRAPQLADIQVLVTKQNTGADGETFYFAYTGVNQLEGIGFRITFTSYAYQTEVEVRDGLLNTLKAGLMPFVAEFSSLDQVEIVYEASEEGTEELTSNPENDPWNYWVFDVDNSGSFSMQESQMSTRLFSAISADRITEKFKFRSGARYSITLEEFKDDDAIIKSKREFKRANIDFVYSLSPRWSAGFFPRYTSSTFSNRKHEVSADLGIEYNIYPWDRSDRQIFTLSYRIGPRYLNYYEETIFDKMEETLGRQQLRLDFITRQNWGTIQAGIRTSSFLHDLSKYRVSANFSASLRLTKVLSIFMGMEGESIHDQLNLPKGNLSREDILLEIRQLQTNFFFSSQIGFSLTFGSIYNNVVNPRFE